MKKNVLASLFDVAKVAILLLVAGFGVTNLYAQSTWTPAPSNPPANNVAAPINVSSLMQRKLGPLFLGTTAIPNPPAATLDVLGWASTTSLFSDYLVVSKGVTFVAGSPMKMFTFGSSGFTLVDGTQGAGKVLTSNASGLATWQTLPVSPATGPSTRIIAGSGITISPSTGVGDVTVSVLAPTCTPTLSVGATFTTSGQYTVPAGVTSIQVEAWGAGGGGGTSSTSDGSGNGIREGGTGGGSGSYSRKIVAVTPGQTYTVTVGTGGTASTNRFVAAGDGGSSSFVLSGGATVISANGGKGGISFGNGYPTPATLGGLSVVLPSRDARLDQNGEYVLGGLGGAVGTGDTTTPGNPGGTLNPVGWTTASQAPTPGGLAISGTTGGAYGKGGNGNDQNTAIAVSQGQAGGVVVSVAGGCSGSTSSANGVTSIVAGTGVKISPANGTGVVTVGLSQGVNTISDIRSGLIYTASCANGQGRGQTTASCTATCTTGKKVVSGSCVAKTAAGNQAWVPYPINTSAPEADGSGWSCNGVSPSSNVAVQVVGSAICL